MTIREEDRALALVQAAHPGWRVFRSRRPDGSVGDDWVASRRDGRVGVDPTVICRNAEELHAALATQLALARGCEPDPAELDLPGWRIWVEGNGLIIADAQRTYSLYQRMAGVHDQATARGVEELRILCDAYDALAEALVRAEAANRSHFERSRI